MPATPSPQIESILTEGAANGASDVHFVVGSPPIFRIEGQLVVSQDQPVLTPPSMQELVFSMLSNDLQQKLLTERELDFAYHSKQNVRFRLNIHWEKGNLGVVARVIPSRIPSMEELRLPEYVRGLVHLKQGLILVTGPTGSGKSTTLASMVSTVNQEQHKHIVTLEDPIEYLFTANKSVIKQRELYKDFLSYGEALKSVVRMDPDVIMVGEMRDLETISAAMTVAETGHLVLGTLHTLGSAETIDRIIDVFPPHQQNQIRMQLSTALRAVISQQLVTSTSGGRIAAREVMVNTPAIANLIRENKVSQLRTVLQTSAEDNMMTFDQDMRTLFLENLVSRQVAESYMVNPELLN